MPYLENGNPIRVHRWDDILSAEQGAFGGDDSFAMFELAVRYLIDEGGLGKTAEDAKRVFLDIRAGLSFADAFENRFGMSLAEYEASFDSLMQEYLD